MPSLQNDIGRVAAMTAYEQRRDAMARILAASLMGLVRDPTGAKLPEDCWRQMVPKANAILFIVSRGVEHETAGKALEHDLFPEAAE
jgi:hypothetical protein